MPSIGSLVRFAIGVSRRFVGRLLLFVLFGIILNIALFVYLPIQCPLSSSAAWGDIWLHCTASILLGALFLLLFPILYALLGYKNAVQNALYYTYTENKTVFFEYITHKWLGKLPLNQQITTGVVGVAAFSQRFFDKLDNLPFALRAIVGALKKVVPFADIVTQVADEVGDLSHTDSTQKSQIAAAIAQKADQYLAVGLLQPSFTLPVALLLLNLAVFGVALWVGV